LETKSKVKTKATRAKVLIIENILQLLVQIRIFNAGAAGLTKHESYVRISGFGTKISQNGN